MCPKYCFRKVISIFLTVIERYLLPGGKEIYERAHYCPGPIGRACRTVYFFDEIAEMAVNELRIPKNKSNIIILADI